MLEKGNISQIVEQERSRLSGIFTIAQREIRVGKKIWQRPFLTEVQGYPDYGQPIWDEEHSVFATQLYSAYEVKAEVISRLKVLTQFVDPGFEISAPIGIDIPGSLILVKVGFNKGKVVKVVSVENIEGQDMINTSDILGSANSKQQWKRVDLICDTWGIVVGFPEKSQWNK